LTLTLISSRQPLDPAQFPAIGLRAASKPDWHSPSRNSRIGIEPPTQLAFPGAGLNLPQSRIWIALDGHVAAASLGQGRPARLSRKDELRAIAKIFHQSGTDGLTRLQGSFVITIGLPDEDRWIFFRDRLGGRTLHWCRHAQIDAWVFASRAATAHIYSGREWAENEGVLTDLFSLRVRPDPGESAIAGIAQLQPGELLVLSKGELTRQRHGICFGGNRPKESCDHWLGKFQDVFTTAVADSFDSQAQIGIQLSGGMDSGAVAVVAQNELSRSGRALKATSWFLPEHRQSCESRWIKMLADSAGIHLTHYCGDALLPFDRLDTEMISGELPIHSAFRQLQQSCYETARSAGIEILMSGHGGDQIYPNRRLLLLDQWKRRDFNGLLNTLAFSFGRLGLSAFTKDPALRHPLGRAIRPFRSKTEPPGWLTAEAARLWKPHSDSFPPEADGYPFPAYARELLGPRMTLGLAYENDFSSRLGIERRDPFQNEALVRLMLEMPFSMSFHKDQDKWIMRQAMDGLMPDNFRLKPRTGRLNSFFNAGFEKNRHRIHELLFKKCQDWQYYVKRDFVETALQSETCTDREKMVINQCVGHALWREYWQNGSE
jgi:asparagine synthase (glutamine-hydrolysing)